MLTGHLNIDNTALKKRCLETSTNPAIASIKSNINDSALFKNILESHEEARLNPASNPHLWPEFSQVIDHLKTLIIDTRRITMSWYNITLPGGSMGSHRHVYAGDSVFVYYVNCGRDHSPLEVLIDDEWVVCDTVTGTWLLFSKDTWHRAGANAGPGNRISISVNIGKPIY
jgi:hypothetical protein